MTFAESAVKVAILDDYQNVALQMADWSPPGGAGDHHCLQRPPRRAGRRGRCLAPFEVVCVMRERTPLTRGLLNGYRA
jgi:hypothetical protein